MPTNGLTIEQFLAFLLLQAALFILWRIRTYQKRVEAEAERERKQAEAESARELKRKAELDEIDRRNAWTLANFTEEMQKELQRTNTRYDSAMKQVETERQLNATLQLDYLKQQRELGELKKIVDQNKEQIERARGIADSLRAEHDILRRNFNEAALERARREKIFQEQLAATLDQLTTAINENTKLKQENADITQENALLKEENATLKEGMAGLRQQITDMEQQIAALTRQVQGIASGQNGELYEATESKPDSGADAGAGNPDAGTGGDAGADTMGRDSDTSANSDTNPNGGD